ncbi:hypothetical protein PNU74_10865, partial [[Ruminococcus] gnavus]|uniref:hypothetical protein n=1 Tax=Lachnospiraceae TaxID=186803 RepID=UPI001D07D39A
DSPCVSASIKPDEKGKPQSGFLFAAGTQGIAALAAQGGVATLSERSERRPRIADFISGRGKLRRTHDTWSLDYV